MNLIVDSSVAIKWHHIEEDSGHAEQLFKHSLLAPELLLAEVANAGWKFVRRAEFESKQLEAMLNHCRRVITEWLPLNALTSRASQIAVRLDHPVYDAYYLAAAEQTGRPVVSADRRLLRRCAGTEWEHRIWSLKDFIERES